MIVMQNILFSFVFVNLHYQERLHLFQEGDFCFICMQISCFHLNRYTVLADSIAKLNLLCFSHF